MQDDPQTLDEKNIRKILLFLEEYDQTNASWENALAFLNYLKFTMRLSFSGINRQYLERLYRKFQHENLRKKLN